MRKFLIPIILIFLIVILIISWLAWRGYQIRREKEGIIITSYQEEYSKEENPRIKINNNSGKTVCFSSCYPYYLEKNNGSLQSYRYGNCPYPDVTQICLEPGQVRAFELLLDKMEVEKGVHRIAIPACIGCALQENFRQDRFFYSNKFTIK